MYRTALCLLIVLASATVAAREVKLSSANGGSCPEAATEKDANRALNRSATPPTRDSKAPAERAQRHRQRAFDQPLEQLPPRHVPLTLGVLWRRWRRAPEPIPPDLWRATRAALPWQQRWTTPAQRDWRR